MPVVPGDTFLLTGGRVATPHLWVVLWGPAGEDDAFLVVMLTSDRGYTDQTCILDVGDHPFIRHRTSVDYKVCSQWRAARIQEYINTGVAKPRAQMDAAVLQRIREGFFRAGRLPNTFLRVAQEEFGVDPPGRDTER